MSSTMLYAKSLLLATSFIGSTLALWPLPSQYTNGSTVLWLSKTTTFQYRTPDLVCDRTLTFINAENGCEGVSRPLYKSDLK